MSENQLGVTLVEMERLSIALDRSLPNLSGIVYDLCKFSKDNLKSVAGFLQGREPVPLFQSQLAEQFRSSVEENLSGEPTRESLFWLAFCLYALQRERQLRRGSFSNTDASFREFFQDHYKDLTIEEQFRVDYLTHKLPAEIALQMFSDKVEAMERKLSEKERTILEGADKVSSWSEQLGHWHTRVAQLQETLANQLETTNFIGLSKAFKQMMDAKNLERWLQISGLVLTGALLLLIPIAATYFHDLLKLPSDLNSSGLLRLVPLAAAEFIVLYFFRIFLRNYYSAKAQLLQLHLRYSVCAFVQNYSQFASEMRKNDDKSLDRFEGLVFSGISPDPSNVPSHFDGIEVLTGLLKELRGK